MPTNTVFALPTGLLDAPDTEAIEMKPVLEKLIPEILNKSYSTKITDLPDYQAVRKQPAAYQGRLALAIATAMQRCGDDYRVCYTLGELLGTLMRGTLDLDEADYLRLFKLYGLDFSGENPSPYLWPYYPVTLTLAQISRAAKKQGQLGQSMLDFLAQLLQYSNSGSGDLAKVNLKTQEILSQMGGGGALPTILFADGDAFGQQLNQFLTSLDPAAPATAAWLRLLQIWQKANAGQPTAKMRKELDTAIAAVGPDAVCQQARLWLELLVILPVIEQQQTHDYGDGTFYHYTSYPYILEANTIVAKGLIWTMQPLADAPMLHLLANLAVKCYRKIPGKGPLAAGLGNAALLVLSQCGLPGISSLARVRPKIKQSNTQDMIARYIEKASQELGVSPAEIEDMAAPDFGLKAGKVVTGFNDYTATLTLAHGKAEIHWGKANNPLKTAPAALKATHAAELKELKSNQTQVQQTYTALRDHLDRSFVEERRIPWPWFEQYYFQHGLMSELARPLIWRLHRADGTFQDALWQQEQWQDAHGLPMPAPTADTQLQLWHPVLSPTEEVLAWRALLEQARLRQPLKQAFREVYLLTPPEERTGTYSNRMAAHVLKQHQFNSLAKVRGWKYNLMGAYDKGYETDIATLNLPVQGLQAQFWVSEVNADDAFNDTGIWNYIATDQVRFAERDGTAVPLTEIPPLVFSEVMRDVDLFVGVASVGNDPAWRDNGGLPAYRTYWESYSFGELGEVAKNRRLALERLVPRLKIGKVSELRDKFLVVRGKRRTYKIHLGSGNILMEPNDQYLCIVPDRSAKTLTSDVFLPFEGDAVLSIILSKAQLLMDDDLITDETINRQIG